MTTAVLNENHNKIINKKDSKHKDLMNRHKTYHEKSLNAWSKKAEKIAIATENEVKEVEKAKKKEWSDTEKANKEEWSETIMKLTKQRKPLISQVQTKERSALARDKFHQMELNKMQNAHKKQKQQMKTSQNTILKTKAKFHMQQMKVSEQTK